MTITKETDLYQPVKALLEANGYAVKSEVGQVDIMAVKDDEVLLVELKLRFNLQLLMQAIEGQKKCSNVYVAIPITGKMRRSKAYKRMVHLLKRLHLGLFLVHEGESGARVEIALNPDFSEFRTNLKAQKKLMTEFTKRSFDLNTGGMVQQQVISAYREKAIALAVALMLNGPMKTSEIRALTGFKEATQVLADNHYGWFVRISRGVYALLKDKEEAIKSYGVLYELYVDRYKRP